MSDLTGKFSTLEAEITSIGDEAHSQRESEITAIGDVQTAVDNVGAQIAALRNLLLSAIGQNDPCATCPPPSLITPVTSPTTQPANSDKCQRVQAFLNALHEITGVFGAVSNNAIVWTPSVVTSGISEVLTTLVTGGSVPLPSFGESVNIAGDTINYALSNIGRGDDLQAQFDTLSATLQAAIFDATSPSDDQTQYASVIDASALPNDEKLLFKALGFNALFSYFFDPTSTPDLSPYDGTICGPGTGCVEVVSAVVAGNAGGGPFSTIGFDYLQLGCAGGGGSTVDFLENGTVVSSHAITPGGDNEFRLVTGTNVSYRCNGSAGTVFVFIQKCVGTLPG